MYIYDLRKTKNTLKNFKRGVVLEFGLHSKKETSFKVCK